jgi:hypothetical protein
VMVRDYSDVAKHERQKMNVTQACVHIMVHATKYTKFAAYQSPFVSLTIVAVSIQAAGQGAALSGRMEHFFLP